MAELTEFGRRYFEGLQKVFAGAEAGRVRRAIDRLRNWANMRPAKYLEYPVSRELYATQIAALLGELAEWERLAE